MGGDDWDPNEEYVTRCICGFTHDDGYMICCDGCSVWQHIECMQVDPNNVPDKYMCEHCEPRPTDKKRARLIQLKKREDISELDEEEDDAGVSSDELHKVSRRKKRKVAASKPPTVDSSSSSSKPPPVKRSKEDTKEPEKKKIRKRSVKASPAVKMSHSNTNIALEDTFMQDLWDISLSPWSDKYENIHQSRYTEQVKAITALKSQQIKSEAISYSKEEYSSIEAKRPLAKFTVSEVQKRRRGVLTLTSLTMYELVMEYKGKFTLRNVVTAELGITGKFIWKHRPCPYVYCYEKIPGIDLCIDARQQGNLARFMRRSCTPNSELKHMLVNNELKIGVFALTSIKAGSEITLPFDFPYEQCDYPVDCACNQGMSCQVMRANFTIVNRMQIGRFIPVNDENQPCEDDGWSRSGSRSSETLMQSSSSQLLQRHWRHKRGSSHSQSPPTTTSSLSTLLPESDSIDSDDDSVLVDHDTSLTVSGNYSKKHKNQQPGNEGRRKDQMSKLLDGIEFSKQYNNASDVSPLHSYQMRVNSKKGLPQVVGQKVRLLPVTNKYNHQDSDGELLSPPLQASFPDHTTTLHVPSIPLPDMGFKVTSRLHPKFLIAKFPLPRKKAILKKWEEERTSDEKGHVLNGHFHKTLGFELKGPLKRRWFKSHNHNGSSNGLSVPPDSKIKANHSFSLPFKKQTLLKWRTTPSEEDTRLPVNECSVTSVVLNENELCEDEKPVKSMDSSKTSELHEELSNDSKTETLSDFTLPDQEITEDNSISSQEDVVEDMERTCEPVVSKLTCASVVESDAASVVTEKPLHVNTDNVSLSTIQPATEATTASTVSVSPPPPGSPEPLVVDDSATSHECGSSTSHDATGEVRSDKLNSDQPSDVKSSSGTDTPQQGKRKKVSLLEYRNRARKCTDHQKSTDTPHSSGQNSPVSPNAPLALLSKALTSLVSQFPASSLQSTLSNSLLGIGTSMPDNATPLPSESTTSKENLTPLPQFEAISPGDSDDNWDTTPVNSQDEDSLGGPLPTTGLALSSLMFGGGSGIASNLSPYSPMPSQFHLHSQQWSMDEERNLQQHHFSSLEEQQSKTTSRQNH